MQDKKQKSGIYCIENIQTNKKYIGQSVDINDRWRRHISKLNHNSHYNDYFQKAWNKYGKESFEFYVLEYCSVKDLDEREIYYIELYQTTNRDLGYNLRSGGQNGGSMFTEESIKKLSQSIKNSYTEELKNQRSKDALEQWSNPEIKAKIIGKNNGMYGKHHTEETRKKISEINKGRKSWRRDITPVRCVELDKEFIDSTDAGKIMNLDGSCILKVCQGKRKTCGGYHWEFIKEEKK